MSGCCIDDILMGELDPVWKRLGGLKYDSGLSASSRSARNRQELPLLSGIHVYFEMSMISSTLKK